MFIGLTLFTRVDVDQVSTLIISTRTSAALRYVNNLWMMLNIIRLCSVISGSLISPHQI